MTYPCDWCGAPDPQWIKWVDQSPTDYLYRKLMWTPGPTAKAYRACEACLPKMNASFPSDHDQAVIAKAQRELASLPTVKDKQ